MVNLGDAKGKPIQLMGTISLCTKVGKYQAMVKFVLSRQFSTDAILGCDFLDQHTNWIGTRSKTLIRKDHSEVPIFRRPVSKMPILQHEKENINTKRERKLFSNIRVAKRIKLAGKAETNILASCEDSGSFFCNPSSRFLKRKDRC